MARLLSTFEFNALTTIMMNRQLQRLLLSVSATVTLVACGGGGSDAGAPVPVTTSFPLQAGYKALTAAGASNNYAVRGTCSGTATVTDSAPIAASFEGVSGYSATSTLTVNLTNCTPASSSATGTTYYGAEYVLLGTSDASGEYGKVVTVPPPLPASVQVGDAGPYASLTVYADSTKATVTGTRLFSYVVEADTASTAIVNLIAKDYDTANNLLFTQQSRYRIAADGRLTSISIDAQASTTGTVHLLFTKV
jgi:hypothetical protein